MAVIDCTVSPRESTDSKSVSLNRYFRKCKQYLLLMEFWFISIDRLHSPQTTTEEQKRCLSDARIAIGIYDPTDLESFQVICSWLAAFFNYTTYTFDLELFLVGVGDHRQSQVPSAHIDAFAQRILARDYRYQWSDYSLQCKLYSLFEDLFENQLQFHRRFTSPIEVRADFPKRWSKSRSRKFTRYPTSILSSLGELLSSLVCF